MGLNAYIFVLQLKNLSREQAVTASHFMLVPVPKLIRRDPPSLAKQTFSIAYKCFGGIVAAIF